MPILIDKIPQELKTTPQWVCWKAVPKGNGKVDKPPVNPNNGQLAKTNNSKTWGTFTQAVKHYQSNGLAGIGFVFAADDPYFGIDYDHCLNDGKVSSMQIEAHMDSLWTYSEISPSGEGLHSIGKGKLPGRGKPGENFEIYDQGRYFTMTGEHFADTPMEIKELGKEVTSFYHTAFGKGENPPGWEKEARKSKTPGYRTPNIGKLAGRYIRMGLSDQEALDLLYATNKNNQPSLTEEKVKDTYLGIKETDARKHPDIPPSTSEVRRTDLGNAELFVAQHGDRMRYNWSTGQWLFYDGMRWNPYTGKATAQCLAFDTARSILEKATKINDTQQRKDATKWSFSSESSFRIRAMLEMAKALKPIECYAEDLDKDQFLLNLENGTLDLRTGELREHNPDDMITKLAPVTWNGEVSSLNDNELWLRCVATWMSEDEPAINYLKRLGGMCLTGSTTSRVFPIFWGPGKNGKNSFLDTLMKLMGDYAVVAPRSLLRGSYHEEHATELAGLIGSRFVVASETKRNMVLKTSLVKSFTGDARMRTRFMRQDYFDFTPTFKVILMTQNLPIIDEVTDAIWDRVHRVGWDVRIPDEHQDDQLLEKLKSEWPHILGWFVEGCLEWQQDGHLKSTEKIRQGTLAYRIEMNPLKEFIEEMCVKKAEYFVSGRTLKKEFDEWSTDKKQLSGRDFASYMRESGYLYAQKKVDKKPVKCWFGLRLREITDE